MTPKITKKLVLTTKMTTKGEVPFKANLDTLSWEPLVSKKA
jgi:hypothetical protein